MIDITLRCFSKARWLTVAKSRNILDASDNPMPGYQFPPVELNPVILTPAIIDAQGNITTPAVLDTWYWVNMRIHGSKFEEDIDTVFPGEEADNSGMKFTRSKFAKFVRDQATPVNLTFRGKTIRTYQFGATNNRIQLIDPRDYAPWRMHEWMGGYSG